MPKIYQEYSIEEIIKKTKVSAIFYKWLRRELVYTSNAIEFNKLTREETGTILNSGGKKLKNKYKDSIETINLATTLDQSLCRMKKGAKIDTDFIKSMHFGIMNNIDTYEAGFYRNGNVRPLGCISGYSNYVKIPKRMDELTKFINDSGLSKFDVAIQAHFELASIHPFFDGNGRTARLLMNIILMNDGIVPIFVTPETRGEYIDVLDNCRTTGDDTSYRKFMLHSYYISAFTVCDFLEKNK